MGLKGFERRLERLVEGTFERVFRSSVRPVELGRRLTRAMDDARTVDVRGATAVPNEFTFSLAPDDYEQFVPIEAGVVRDLAEAAREHARAAGYTFKGPVRVHLVEDPALRTGSFDIEAHLHEGPGGRAGGLLRLPDGTRIELADTVVVIGRSSDADVHLPDSSVSRRHAEVRPVGNGYAVVDVGSTNGTRVNGNRLTGEHPLAQGDSISVGDVQLHFEAS